MSICVPVGVEATLELLAEMSSPDSLEGTQASWGLHIADDASHDHGRSLQDGHSLHNLLLVGLCNNHDNVAEINVHCQSYLYKHRNLGKI